jgi:hypothetical protein
MPRSHACRYSASATPFPCSKLHQEWHLCSSAAAEAFSLPSTRWRGGLGEERRLHHKLGPVCRSTRQDWVGFTIHPPNGRKSFSHADRPSRQCVAAARQSADAAFQILARSTTTRAHPHRPRSAAFMPLQRAAAGHAGIIRASLKPTRAFFSNTEADECRAPMPADVLRPPL